MDMKNNPGLCAYILDVRFDGNALKLVDVQNGRDFAEMDAANFDKR